MSSISKWPAFCPSIITLILVMVRLFTLFFTIIFIWGCSIEGSRIEEYEEETGPIAGAFADTTLPNPSGLPAFGTVLGSISNIDIVYPEAVTGADTLVNYTLSGAGMGTLAITNVTNTIGNTYRLSFSGVLTDGLIIITISGVSDNAGNTLTGFIAAYTGSAVDPTQTATPISGTDLNALSQVDIAYSDAMTGAGTLTNYTLTGSGIGSLALASVTPLGGNIYRLALTGTPSEGDIDITINNVTDLAGNPLAGTVITYTADSTAPTQTSAPAAATVLNSLTQVDILYSEAVNGADTPFNYALSGAGAGSLSVSTAVNITGSLYRLSFSGTPANGALLLTISNVSDLVGNALGTNTIAYTIDLDGPTFISNPVALSTHSSISEVELSYSETVLGANQTFNYIITGVGAGTLAIDSITDLGGNTYRVSLTGEPSDGAFDIVVNPAVTDLLTNPIVANTVTFIGDRTSPNMTPTPAANTGISSLPKVDLVFDEAVNGADVAANYSLSGAGVGTLAVAGASLVSGNHYEVTFSGTPVTGGIILTAGNVSDLADNPLINATVAYVGDFVSPTQTTVPADGMTLSRLPYIDITFNEPVLNATVPTNFVVSGVGAGSLTANTATDQGNNVYRITFTGTPVVGALTVTFNNITDLAGNALTGTTVNYTGITWHFVENSVTAGLSYTHAAIVEGTQEENVLNSMSGGVAAGDYDQDGFIDLYAVGGTAGNNHFFHNNGDGTFTDIIGTVGIGQSGLNESGPNFVDLDGDGDLDLVIGGMGDGIAAPANTTFKVLDNQAGTYVDITGTTGISIPGNIDNFSITAGDINGDQYLDLFLTHWRRGVSHGDNFLFTNNQDGTFSDSTAAFGLTGLQFTFAATFAHLNNDSFLDLFIASDAQQEKIYLNNSGTSLTDVSGPTNGTNAMGSAVADFDNDGDNDWFVSHIYDLPGYDGNRFYLNDGAGDFTEVSEAAGLRNGGWGWAACAADFNNDTHTDIFHVNGMLVDFVYVDDSVLFINNGDTTFTEKAAFLNLVDGGQGRGVSCFDADRDGDIDIFVFNNTGTSAFYINNLDATNNYITIKLNGVAPNTEGLGSKIILTLGANTYRKDISNGNNYISQDPAEAHFGLGTAGIIDAIDVTWADGAVTNLTNVTVNQRLIITHP